MVEGCALFGMADCRYRSESALRTGMVFVDRSEVSDAKLSPELCKTIVVNMTGVASAFHHGYTARMVINGELHTFGEGDSGKQAIPLFSNWFGGKLWGDEADKIIDQCACKQ